MVRVGIVGCGHWGKNHLRVFHEHPESELAAFCDQEPEAVAEAAERYGRARRYEDYRELLADPRIDAVVVATSASTHAEIAREAIKSGRHVLVEKPFALRSDEAESLVHLAADRELVCMVGHTFLYNPAVRAMHDYLHRPEFGSCYYLQSARTHLGLIRRDVNSLWDLAPHDIAIFNYLLDAWPLRVSAVGGTYVRCGNEDVAMATLTYPGGILANLRVSWVDSHKVREVVAVGSRRRIVFDDLNHLEPLRIFDKGVGVERPVANYGEFQHMLRDGEIVSPKIEMTEPLKLMAGDFLRCVQTGDRPLSDGGNGVAVVRILEALQTSMRRGGAPVDLRMPTPPATQALPVAPAWQQNRPLRRRVG